MTTNDILVQNRRRPFAPYRLVTSDGMVYDIRGPELAVPGPGSVVIFHPSSQPGAFERYDVVSLRHVVRLEPSERPIEEA